VKIGVGLPNTTPAGAPLTTEWSRRAETGPFSTVAVLDRLVYDSVDPLIALTAAAAVTERVGLATMVAIGPLRNSALLAKQAASIDAIAAGRLTLGLAVGARLDDYEIAGVEHGDRGRRLAEQLAFLRTGWGNAGIGPAPARPGGPRLLVGGASGRAFARMARYADGYAHGGGPPRAFAGAAARARAAWSACGRPGEPELWGQAYFALGDEDVGAAYLRHYYAFAGPFAEKVASANLTSERAIRNLIGAYEDEGCDQLILLPTVSDPEQLDRLAAIVA